MRNVDPDPGGLIKAKMKRKKNAAKSQIISREGRVLDFLDFQPVATDSRCKMIF
jgi:hypothetical protein